MLREKAGISRAEAARRMHLSASGYCNYENGLRDPSWQVLFVMAAVLGTSIEFLIGQTDDDAPTHVYASVSEIGDAAEIAKEYAKLSNEAKNAVMTILKEINRE